MTIKPLPLKFVILLSLNLALGIGCLLLQPKTNQELAYIKEIQSQLNNLEQSFKKPAEKVDLSAINQDFKHLESLIDELKTKDDSQLNQLVIDSRTQLENKLDAMHSMINSLDTKQHPIKYLTVKDLPFEVVSIDSIQQVSVANVAYDYRTIPLEKSDVLAGWTVIAVDFSRQKIEFENGQKEHVVVAMAGVEEHA